MYILNYFRMSIVIFALVMSLVCSIGIMPVFAQTAAGPSNPILHTYNLNAKQHPLTPVTAPTPFGNGTVLQLVIVYSASPTGGDSGLAEYNKAVNFERAKSIILGSNNTTTTLQSIINDLDKQRVMLQAEGQNIKRYNTDGSITQEYSNYWMESYVTYRLEADGIQAISGEMQQGMSFQTALNQVEQSMQQILANYDVNGAQSTPSNSNDNQMTTPVIISVTTDKSSYNYGDGITISASAQQYIPNTPMMMKVISPTGTLFYSHQMEVESDKTFSASISGIGSLWKDGTYTIIVYYGQVGSAQTTFRFTGSGQTSVTPSLPPTSNNTYLRCPDCNSTNSTQPPTNSTITPKIPHWVKTVFNLYGQGQVSDDDLISALRFLIQTGIIRIS